MDQIPSDSATIPAYLCLSSSQASPEQQAQLSLATTHSHTHIHIWGLNTRIFVTLKVRIKTHAEHGTRPLGRGQTLYYTSPLQGQESDKMNS